MSTSRLPELIERLGNLLRAGQRRAAGGLQPVHLQVLGYLARCNRFSDTPAALTAFLDATKGTVSQTLAVLERDGLVERRADPDDRRVVHFSLTPAGRGELNASELPHGWAAALADLPARDREAATAVLEHLLGNLQRRNDGRTFGACRSCRYLQRAGRQYRCGLNGETLSADDTQRICHEHAFADSG